jgi:hypothetical protein
MKTTVEIPDSLFAEAKACADSRGVPFRRIVEEGLRAVIEQGEKTRKAFKLRDGSFGGKSIRAERSWSAVRQEIYAGRGE